MIIAGLQKTTLIDYPGKIACIVFLAGCNFRCPWCYSSELVLPLKIAEQPRISEKQFFDFLRERKGLLDGVVICGGEPTINKDLPSFIEKIKNLPFDLAQGERYSVKLDTNGSNPAMLKDLVRASLIDYVAMDIKGPAGVYEKIMGEGVKMEDIKESVEFLKRGSLDFEFRTTVVNTIHTKEDFVKIAKWIGEKNVKYYLQKFRAEKTIDPDFEKIQPFKKEFLEEIVKEISPYFKDCKVRA
ncbi:MAG: anaerobic ribonucleoside-triphosphate reductase activating protein [Candidatus Staskawiczbacteria bacterium]|nr:anaerobic ribonucleoside-triphosphate reductase activating protein [Candidatus Staskawiczbacteria bacterium]